MKQILALLLAVVLSASLAACDEGEQTPNDNSNPQTSIADNHSTTGTDTPSGSEASSEPAFDTGWASNAFEKLIPELPFDGWTVVSETDTVYKLEVLGLNTGPSTNPPDSGEKDGADKDTLLAYLNALPGYGFTLQETGEGYQWLTTDTDGNEIEFMIGDGGCWVTISKKAAA